MISGLEVEGNTDRREDVPTPSRNGTANHDHDEPEHGYDEPSFPQDERPPPYTSGLQVGDLSLVMGQVRKTPSKIIASVNVTRGGELVAHFILTPAAASRRDAARTLTQILREEIPTIEIEAALITLIAEAVKKAAQVKSSGKIGPTVRQIVADKVPAALRLAYRGSRGLWSEARRGEMTRNEFVSFTPTWLMGACAEASDTPINDDGIVKQQALLGLVEAALKVIWSDLFEQLPREEDAAELRQDSEAARRFRGAIIRLWSATKTFEVVRATSDGQSDVAARSSLIARAVHAASPYLGRTACIPKRSNWQSAQNAFSAWWRPHIDSEGEICLRLAMRWELAGQIGVEVPGVVDQDSLRELGIRYGVFMEYPDVSATLSGGSRRLAVLSDDLTRELTEMPSDQPDGTETESAVTEIGHESETPTSTVTDEECVQ